MPNDLSPNARQAYALFLQLGYQPHQAAGIVGNLMQEAGAALSPSALGDSRASYGIAQWRDSRRAELMRYAAKNGMSPSDLETQVRFLDNELRTTERGALDLLNRARTPEEAASAFLKFERPSGYSDRNPQLAHGYDARIRNAQLVASSGTGDPSGVALANSDPTIPAIPAPSQDKAAPPSQGQYAAVYGNPYGDPYGTTDSSAIAAARWSSQLPWGS